MFGNELWGDFGHARALASKLRRKQAATGITNEKRRFEVFWAEVGLNRAAIGDQFGAQHSGEEPARERRGE